MITKDENVSQKAQNNDSPTRESRSQAAFEDKEEMKGSYFLEDLDLLDNDGEATVKQNASPKSDHHAAFAMGRDYASDGEEMRDQPPRMQEFGETEEQ